ncbi:hypothetical protein [Macrococcus armenti]|uniref:hypothetical protein n=1 Tax=Macrococcus armenti TaxID=2875764 RepID=UPI001CC996E0|nr:hypothetical protein [Macrococcus armenti]UBH07829.1 hypothetical protein LAU41_07285 [Macrococcus armenti]
MKYSKLDIKEKVVTRREAEQIVGLSSVAFQHHLRQKNIVPFKENGAGKGKVQLFWREDLKKISEVDNMKKAVLTEEQVQQLAKKCEGMEDVSIIKDFPGRDHITFKNGDFRVEVVIDVNSTKVKAYALVGLSEFGTEETNVTTVEELYSTLRNYEKYFLTGGEATRTMLWIKQMFM